MNSEKDFLQTDLRSFESLLAKALQLEIPYDGSTQKGILRLLSRETIPAAVLLLFAYSQKSAQSQRHYFDFHLLYTRRTETVETHKGQISFPGGHCEPSDKDGPIGTALRETEEEVGVSEKSVKVIGQLPRYITGTGFSIQPVVGVLQSSLEEVRLLPNQNEIAEAFWVTLDTLLQPGIYRQEYFLKRLKQFPTDVYQVDAHRIWGATGSMTKNLLDRLLALS